MCDCLTCEYAYYNDDRSVAFCTMHNTYVYIPLDSSECNAYKPTTKPLKGETS